MDSPRNTLSKVYDYLNDDGKLLINISHVLMENEIWDQNGQRPWVEMEHMARGTPVVYYNKKSLRILLALSGFKVIEEFTFQHPKGVYFQGRQETFLIAEKSTKKPRQKVLADFKASQNALSSEQAVLNFCRDASKKSIQIFQDKFKVTGITLLCDDSDYASCLKPIFKELNIGFTTLCSEELYKLSESKSDFIFNTLDEKLVSEKINKSAQSIIINVLQPVMFNSYGLTTKTKTGKIIMARSCLPVREFGSDIFPWKKQIEVIKFVN